MSDPSHPSFSERYATFLNILFPPLEVIDLEDRTIELGPRQGYVIPRGVTHRTRAPEHAVVLMVEGAGIVPTGD
ncbi:MAG TPA: hypothetical protein VIH26_09065 [Anaerolineales bacterium]